uniref:Transmembrane protein 170B n=1 Tax=Oncorhynchus kisutch TaxID=8019 RepID=A0A8C7MG21_ONCKI
MSSSKATYSHLTKRDANPGGGRNMNTNRDYSINLSVQQVLSLWVQGTTLQHFTEMWYWVFLWCLFSSLFVHGAMGLLMLVMLQRHKRGRLITLVLVSVGFLASLAGGVITSKSPPTLCVFGGCVSLSVCIVLSVCLSVHLSDPLYPIVLCTHAQHFYPKYHPPYSDVSSSSPVAKYIIEWYIVLYLSVEIDWPFMCPKWHLLPHIVH